MKKKHDLTVPPYRSSRSARFSEMFLLPVPLMFQSALVQIGRQLERLPIGRIIYRIDRTAFHTAGAASPVFAPE